MPRPMRGRDSGHHYCQRRRSKTNHGPIPVQFQAAGNPQKIANPDAAGLLIAQFYPDPTTGGNGKTLDSNGHNWASPINNPLDWSEWNVRADYNITKKNRVTFRWTQESWDNPTPNNGSSFWGESNYPTVQSSWSQPSKSVMAKLSSTISPTMVNDVEFGYGHNAIITTLGGTRASIVGGLETAYPASFPSSIKTPGEFFGGWGGLNPYGSSQGAASFWNIAPYKNHEDLYTVQDNLTKVHGNHLLKAGAFFSSNIKVENSGNGADRPTLPTTVHCDTDAANNPITGPGHPACGNTDNLLANVLLPGTGASRRRSMSTKTALTRRHTSSGMTSSGTWQTSGRSPETSPSTSASGGRSIANHMETTIIGRTGVLLPGVPRKLRPIRPMRATARLLSPEQPLARMPPNSFPVLA